MCLGIPGRVTSLVTVDGLLMGRVDFGGVRKDVCLSYLPETGIGDYVVVHVGFAISRLDEEEALRTLEIIRSIPGAFALELEPAGDARSEG
jgi:hydrogenase expression/formation protein HypC